ncbi:cell division protein ZapD [Aliidiomarina iranensis]|uniref:Cell division protein ZapD n=1 Tax=Aliidiomarina iranensis TaxID=1434071 RepID=A0A432W2T7_9GAMM|nr:cell division protein ZapD [Aliidiomarina iranensis]RUO23537.1 cell division protein ZapD [Aliidiomarina iranensis]
MAWKTYEHPLEERVRVYLRIEALLDQLELAAEQVNSVNYPLFFGGLFNLLDLLDRTDTRADLIKDLERREAKLLAFFNHPDVDQQRLQEIHQDLRAILQALCEGRKFGYALRDHRLLSNIRQRMGIMGGQCHNELPDLQYWLQTSASDRRHDAHTWLEQLSVLRDALAMEMTMLREQTHFVPVVAENGNWLGNEEKLALLRVRVPADLPVYPLISGHRQRYNIRFMNAGTAERTAYQEAVNFELARCV